MATLDHRGLVFAAPWPSTAPWTLREAEAYLRLLRLTPADRVLDVGAHIGAFAVPASRLARSVAAYEPDPSNFALLDLNLRRNGCRNAVAHRAAVVGGDATSATLYVRPGLSTTRHTLLRDQAAGATRVDAVNVDAVNVDAVNVDVALEAAGANVLKLDAEGAELGILRGLHAWGQIDRLVLEYHQQLLGDGGALWAELLAVLAARFLVIAWRPGAGGRTLLALCSRRPEEAARAASGWPGPGWTVYRRPGAVFLGE